MYYQNCFDYMQFAFTAYGQHPNSFRENNKGFKINTHT